MCYRPITIKNPATGEYMKVPCGKCLDCLRKYQNALSNRMYEEFKSKGFKGVFFTLTYDDNHVPKNYLAVGQVFRSSPDYGYSNVTLDKWNREKAPFRTRKKYVELPFACLVRAGIIESAELVGDGTEYAEHADGEIEDFNKHSKIRDRDEWFSRMKAIFAQHMSLTSPSVGDCHAPNEANVSYDEIEPYLSVEEMTIDDSDIWHIDEETGEMFFEAEPIDQTYYEQTKQWFRENTPIVSFNSVRKEDVQLWIKRNRTAAKRINPNFDFSYFITSEYGPRTLRPHYHGVFFGVTKEDVKGWFSDWRRHYGEIVVFDDLDPLKGGLSYVSKYCSKGFFEHPLCCKDFFYFYRKYSSYASVVCNEYHSKHFEKCMEWFGIDAPIVDPTFHLFSKGLGVEWCKHNNLRCEEFEDVAREYSPLFSNDGSTLQFSNLGISSDALLSGDFDMEKLVYKAKLYEYQKSPDAWLRKFLLRAFYFRNFRFKDKKTGQIHEKCFAFQIPRYYREKIFGTNLRIAYPAFVRSENERLYREKLGQVGDGELVPSDTEKVLALEKEEQQRVIDKFNQAFESQKKFLEKSLL